MDSFFFQITKQHQIKPEESFVRIRRNRTRKKKNAHTMNMKKYFSVSMFTQFYIFLFSLCRIYWILFPLLKDLLRGIFDFISFHSHANVELKIWNKNQNRKRKLHSLLYEMWAKKPTNKKPNTQKSYEDSAAVMWTKEVTEDKSHIERCIEIFRWNRITILCLESFLTQIRYDRF